MGCDIHCYIDYQSPYKDGSPYNFCGRISLGRNYWLFGLLAGVRIDPKELGTKLLYPPRGIPEKLSYQVESEYTLIVLKQETDESGCCTLENAERWVKSGSSQWWGENNIRVTDPDAHTESYLYADELKEIQKQFSSLTENGQPLGPHPMLAAVIAAMEAINNQEPESPDPKCAKFIFWFDN